MLALTARISFIGSLKIRGILRHPDFYKLKGYRLWLAYHKQWGNQIFRNWKSYQ